MSDPATVLVGGVGYADLRDHSVGPLVAERLAERRAREEWPPGVAVENLSYGPVAVHHRMEAADPPVRRLVLVAAVERGRPPGSVTAYRWDGVLPGTDEIQGRVSEAVTGVVGLDNLLIVLGALGTAPGEVYAVEVEPRVEAVGSELSPEVERGAREAEERAREIALHPSGTDPAGVPVAPLGGPAPPAANDPPSRILVAGMGNLLEGDDGFGVRAIEALRAAGELPRSVELAEVGIGGMHLVQSLMAGYDALILLDAVDRGSAPGTVHVLEPRVPAPGDLSEAERSGFLADMHVTVPAKALLLARALGVLPERVHLVGCQPADVELGMELSEPVRRGVAEACRRVAELVAGAGSPGGTYNRESPAPDRAERSLP